VAVVVVVGWTGTCRYSGCGVVVVVVVVQGVTRVYLEEGLGACVQRDVVKRAAGGAVEARQGGEGQAVQVWPDRRLGDPGAG